MNLQATIASETPFLEPAGLKMKGKKAVSVMFTPWVLHGARVSDSAPGSTRTIHPSPQTRVQPQMVTLVPKALITPSIAHHTIVALIWGYFSY